MKRKKINVLTVLASLALFLFAAIVILQDLTGTIPENMTKDEPVVVFSDATAEQKIATFAKAHDLESDAWPDELISLLETNPDTEEFVLNYPLLKDTQQSIDLTGYEGAAEVPLLFQWDTRWGYYQYGDAVMGLSGCGPVCLSMVCLYLLDDAGYDPVYVAKFSQENGYCIPGNGSSWTLISEGGGELGLDVVEIPLDEDRLVRNLEAGNPVICVMGPGDFTATGHFVVMAGYEDGKIKINDPNSNARSQQLWEYEAIESQIRNLWVCRQP